MSRSGYLANLDIPALDAVCDQVSDELATVCCRARHDYVGARSCECLRFKLDGLAYCAHQVTAT
jgi:hypothetical protein